MIVFYFLSILTKLIGKTDLLLSNYNFKHLTEKCKKRKKGEKTQHAPIPAHCN